MRIFRFSYPAILIAIFFGEPALGQDAANQSSAESVATAAIDPDRAPDTLMFTIDDLTDIQGRIASGEQGNAGGSGDAIENASLYLSTILYYGPRDWTIWVNGTPIGPRQDFQSFQVTDIGPSFVELVVPLSAQGMRPVRLAPNQTFVARTGVVVEGKWNQ